MSVCYAAYNARVKSADAYQQVTAGPAWNLLQRMAGLSPAPVRRAWRAACGSALRATTRIPRRTPSPAALLAAARALLGGNLSVAYSNPLHIVRGSMQYLWDADGRRYLDAYNNVPHVGHCHPRVVQAGQAQMAVLNTNTRYLHELVHQYAARLGATLPGALKVCYFVNSGSEANELALRLARAHTRRRELIVLEHAYHGNTTTMIDVSPYKHAGPGGEGAPPWVHVAPLAGSVSGRPSAR